MGHKFIVSNKEIHEAFCRYHIELFSETASLCGSLLVALSNKRFNRLQ